MTFRPSTSAETAERFVDRYEARVVAPRGTAFREVLLSHLGRVTPKWPAQLRAELLHDWGYVGLRHVGRVVAELLEEGLIVRRADGYVMAPARRRARKPQRSFRTPDASGALS